MKKFILTIFLLMFFMPLFAEGEKYHLNLGKYTTIDYEDLTDIYGYRIQLKREYDYEPKEYIVTSKKILTLEEYNEMLSHLIAKTETSTYNKIKTKPIYYIEFARKIKNKYSEYKDMDDLELTKLMINEHPVYKDQVVYPMTKKQNNTNQDTGIKIDKSKYDMDSAQTYKEETNSYEKIKDFFNPEKNPFIALFYILLIISFCFIYPIQIIIVLIGLFFHLFKQKQTVKYLLIPYGFICILRNYYKELK